MLLLLGMKITRMTGTSHSQRTTKLPKKPLTQITIMREKVTTDLQLEASMLQEEPILPEEAEEAIPQEEAEEEAILLSNSELHHPATTDLLQATSRRDQQLVTHRERSSKSQRDQLLVTTIDQTSKSPRDLATILEIANSEWTRSGTNQLRVRAMVRREPRGTTEIGLKNDQSLLLYKH
jgi:hypothetical protein